MGSRIEEPVLHNENSCTYRTGLVRGYYVCKVDANIFTPWICVDWKVGVCTRASSIASQRRGRVHDVVAPAGWFLLQTVTEGRDECVEARVYHDQAEVPAMLLI